MHPHKHYLGVALLLAGGLFLTSMPDSDAAGATLTPVRPPRLWQATEFRISEAPTAENNFDPEQIRLDAFIIPPSGRVQSIPAYWTEEYTYRLADGEEHAQATGIAGWRLRYTPSEPGSYTVTLKVSRAGAPATPIASHAFVVPEESLTAQHGWVRIGPDRRYFETADGRPLRLIGENTCWPRWGGTDDYVAMFQAMQRSGQNFGRIWMCPWWLGIEHGQGPATQYNMDAAARLDRIFELAEEHGIYLLLCLDFHGMYQLDNPHWGGSGNLWPKNPYQCAQGGPCTEPNDFFTHPAAKTVYQKRLRYLIARYGAQPRLLAWQFFNEIDNAYEWGRLNGADVAAWHGEMGTWLKQHDPYGHLVTTSLTGGSDRPEIWSLPAMDFAVYHSYGDTAPARKIATLAEDYFRRYGKPFMIGEFGVDIWGWGRASDPHMRGLRQALWGGALGGTVGSSMSWWWEYIHEDNVYPLYAALSSILDRAGWHEGRWSPARVAPEFSPPPAQAGETLSDQLIYTGRVFLRAEPWFSAVRPVALTGLLAAERAAESLSSYLGPSNPKYQERRITLDGWWGGGANITIRINQADGDVEPVVKIDQKVVWQKTLAAPLGASVGPRKLEEEFEVPVPLGRHQVEISNAKPNWLFVESLKVHGVVPSSFASGWQFGPEAVALRGDEKALVYIVSPHVVFPAGAQRYRPPLRQHDCVALLDWPDGVYTIHWFDPASGTELAVTNATSQEGQLPLTAPDYTEDVVALVTASR